MLAGGIGFGKADQSKKFKPKKGDKVVIIGGDNYRIGMVELQYLHQILENLKLNLN